MSDHTDHQIEELSTKITRLQEDVTYLQNKVSAIYWLAMFFGGLVFYIMLS